MNRFDVIVIGSGPAGQKAAIQAAKAKRSVLVIESEEHVGGACVHHGTIPSKTLRETATALTSFPKRTGGVIELKLHEDLQVASLMGRMTEVVRAHELYMTNQLERNGVVRWHGRARFTSDHELEVRGVDGGRRPVYGETIVIAAGSKPRTPATIPIDHEHVLDSDSILSLIYLPQSLTVLGGGVIACEYASIFAALGVKVTMVDTNRRPMGFFDPELSDRFVHALVGRGGEFLGERKIQGVQWNGVDAVVTTLADGTSVQSEKCLVALGRVANVLDLNIDAAGLTTNARGLLEVDANCQTRVPHIYAAGDVIGAPSLASTSMEQGRRAVRYALGLGGSQPAETIPIGVYTIPEISSVGLTEEEAKARCGGAVVGRALFKELARGQIAGIEDGLLKLVADAKGEKIVGVHIYGEGAAELIHVGQMALLAGMSVDVFVDNVFNFPTLAEGYRVAALDIAMRR